MTACKACDKSIEFVKTATGSTIPLQRIRTVYEIVDGVAIGKTRGPNAGDLYVSHFETCTDPQRFSGGRRP